MQVYADNAATTRMSDKAVAAMTPYFQQFYGNPSSLHTVGQQAAEALADARRRVADCLGCSFKEITFTSGGSEADNQAIVSAARIGERKGKKHIISTAFEHHAVLHTLKKLEKEGFEVTLLDVRSHRHHHPPAGGGGHPGGHLSGDHHVRQQRDRLYPAHPGDRQGVPREGRAVPHRRGAGGGPPAHQREGAEHRHAVPVRPQVPRPQGRGRAVCPAGHPPDQYHRGRRAGTRQAGRHGEHPRHHGSGGGAGGVLRAHRRGHRPADKAAGQADRGTE